MMTKKELYWYRRANGLCTTCGRKSGKKNQCAKCRRKVSERNKFMYEFCKQNGICTECKKKKAVIGTTCQECHDARAKRQIEHSEEYAKKHRKHYAKLRDERIANGLCAKCGKNPAGGKFYCQECLDKARENNRKYRKEHGSRHVGIPKSEWKEYSWCSICGVAVTPGKSLCPKCKSKCDDQAAKMRPRAIEAFNSRRENGLCVTCGEPVKPGYKVCEYHYDQLAEMRQKYQENAKARRAAADE